MKKYYGNYIGIVVQNNDPERAGKIKVFVPHISSTIYNDWVKTTNDKSIRFIGKDDDIAPILNNLKRVLPWAECAAPLVGESASGRFNNFNLTNTISDSNFYSDTISNTSTFTGVGNAPSKFYDKEIIADAFISAGDNINKPNPLAFEYQPNGYSNEAKGSFAIPAVGAHVWVFFREGNPQFPVYFAASFGQTDWKGIYETKNSPGLDYPGTYENIPDGIAEYNHNVETYRNKYVINQKGGTLEFVNSDLNEKVRLTHYSGSFKEMNNQSTIELSTKNNQKLVLNDQYETVRGFKNEYTGKSHDEIIMRDKYKKIGKLKEEHYQEWKKIVSGIQEFKQLFEIKRTQNNSIKNTDGVTVLKRNSILQTRSGSFADFPVTDGSVSYTALANTNTGPGAGYDQNSNSSADGPSSVNDKKSTASTTTTAPTVERWPSESGRSFTNGSGKSLSTQDGTWDVEDKKDKLKELLEANLPDLTAIENELGIGGSEIIQIAKHKTETIGMVMNDFGSIRLDNIGKLLSNEILIDDDGVYINKAESPLLEYTHVQDLPGGNYTLNVCNRYNVVVGAGGLSLKSYGPTNITGTIMNIAGEQVNIGSANEINIDSKTVNISAEILRLRSKNQRQILINDNLGVNKNVIIGGGIHIEGETYLQHVTAPKEWQVTEKTTVFAKLLEGLQFTADISGVATGSGVTKVSVTLKSDSNPDKVQCYDHSHAFVNLPLTLLDGNQAVRQASKELNTGTNRSIASAQHNVYKG